MYNRYDLNGETIRVLVEMLPASVFDYIVEEMPDLLEAKPWKTDYIHWEAKTENYNTVEQLMAEYGNYEDLEEMEEDYWVEEFDEGWLVIE